MSDIAIKKLNKTETYLLETALGCSHAYYIMPKNTIMSEVNSALI